MLTARLETVKSLKASLGKFAGSHVDTGDHSLPPTAMTVFSEVHPDVLIEFFFILDCGVAWVMESLCELFFKGLHFHSGTQAMYRQIRQLPDLPYIRASLIKYPPTVMLNGQDAIALAASPGPKGEGVPFNIGIEMRGPGYVLQLASGMLSLIQVAGLHCWLIVATASRLSGPLMALHCFRLKSSLITYQS